MSAEQVIERLIMEYGDAILRMCYPVSYTHLTLPTTERV